MEVIRVHFPPLAWLRGRRRFTRPIWRVQARIQWKIDIHDLAEHSRFVKAAAMEAAAAVANGSKGSGGGRRWRRRQQPAGTVPYYVNTRFKQVTAYNST
jgi:hypothetical protein